MFPVSTSNDMHRPNQSDVTGNISQKNGSDPMVKYDLAPFWIGTKKQN